MAKKNAQHFLNPKLISLAVASCFTAGTAIANPTGPTVVSGTANIQQAANLLQITNSPNAILNWQRFSIGANEITRFIQQSASSAVLNRVIGAGGTIDPSVILGALQSNGRVFLLNPSGIVFGSGAQIDVAGLVASSLNLSNADFLAGRMKFTDVPGAGSVVNQGNITAGQGGQVYLVAPDVANTGIITTPQGEVVLAAGKSVELVNPGTPNLRVEVTADNEQARNLGQIVADSGRIGIYAGLVSQGGTVRADSAVSEGGHILLKATKNATLEAGSVTTANGLAGGSITVQSGDTTLVSGSIEANGSQGQGGSVQVLGNLVGMLDNANISADGASGGGSVLVGGDYQGKNADVQNAFRTYVGPTTTISADATTNGDGGKVVVWSDDATRFYGNISAKGGSQSGDGGFAEVSGHNYLDYKGLANLGAPNGESGTVLLDPSDITISNATDTFNSGFFASGIFSGAMNPAVISWATIDNQLNLPSNVIITTTGSGGSGNIDITAGHTYASAQNLSLLANNNITLEPTAGQIANTGSGGLTMVAGWDGVSTSAPAVITSGMTPGNQSIVLNGGLSYVGDVTLMAANDITISATSPTANANISSSTQTVNAGGTLTLLGGADQHARLQASGNQSITASNIALTGGSGTLNNGFAQILETGPGATQSITVNGGGMLSLNGGVSGDGNFASIVSNGTAQTINFAAGGSVSLTGGGGTSNDYARIRAVTGTQTIGDRLATSGWPTISLIGGTGGVLDNGNVAQISALAGLQTITAAGTTITAGASGNTNHANIVAPSQDIKITGDLTLNGGGSVSSATQGGGARIGGLGGTTPSATSLTLDVSGNVSMTGGTVANAGSTIGSGHNGGQTTDITMTVLGDVTLDDTNILSGTTAAGSRIGSPISNVAGGNISVSASNIWLNSTNGFGTAIRTTGEVDLIANGGIGITEGANSAVIADKLLAKAPYGNVSMPGNNMVNTLAGLGTFTFAFTNGQALTIDTVGGVQGVTADRSAFEVYGDARVDINVTSGNLTVAQPVKAIATSVFGSSGGAATVALNASAGSIFVNNSVSATGGNSADTGYPANVSLTAANSITVNSNITAAGGTPSCCSGGAANISLTATSGAITVNNSSIAANGGSGSYGGSASVNLTAPNGTIALNNSTLSASGGYGSYAGGAATIGLSAGNAITVNNSTLAAVGGSGGSSYYSNRGGDATISLDAGTGITVSNGSVLSATGGNVGGSGSGSHYGGISDISLIANNGNIDVNASTITATGGDGNNGAYADLYIAAYGGGIAVAGSTMTATGGNGNGSGYYGYGGSGAINLYSSGSGTGVISVTGSSLNAYGGNGSVQGGRGDISLDGANGITVSGSTLAAQGGSGLNYGGYALMSLYAGGSSEMGPSGSGGITIASSTVSATGGSGSSYGGNARLEAIAGSGGITMSGSSTLASTGNSGATLRLDTLGSIQSSGGSLLTLNGGVAGYVDLTAVNGIGTLASPVRIAMIGDPVLNFRNTGTTGDIAISLSGTPYAGNPCGPTVLACIDQDVAGTFNNNPIGTYFVRAENGDIQLNAAFQPGPDIYTMANPLPDQNVILEAQTGNVIIGNTGSIFTGMSSGSGNVQLLASGTLTLASGSYVSGREPLLKANDLDIQGNVLSGSGFIDILPYTAGRGIELGASGPGSGVLALDSSELNRMTGWDGLNTSSAGGGGLVIGDDVGGSGALTFVGTVGPTSAFLNVRGTSISQTGGTITGGINAAASGAISLNQPGNTIDYFMGGSSGNGNITLTTTGPLSLDSVTTAGGVVDIRSTGDISLSTSGAINAGSAGTISLISSGGAILDNHTGADIIGAQATLQGATGIGSLANPVETQIGQLTVAPSGGEVGIYNAGSLQINSLSFSGSSAAINAAGGSMNFGSGAFALSPTTGVSLLADAGMTVGRSLSLSSGNLELYSGGGDLNFSSASALNVSAPSMSLIGTNINVVAGAAPVTVSAGELGVIAGNTLTVQGGSGSGAYSELASTGGSLAVATGGDVVVKGGIGSGAYARLYGNPDVVQTLGGTAHITAGSGSGAYAQIAAAAPTTIYLSLANLSSGGFFVNGVENLVYDPATNTGFTAGGLAAILGQNLLVTYGNATGTALPPQIEQIVNTTLLASVDTLVGGLPMQGVNNQGNEDEKEKDQPQVCK